MRMRLAALASGWILAATLVVVPAVAPLADDDRPSPEQRAKVETALRNMGFVRWGEIERDDGNRAWEVDDAWTADGRQYDLRLAADDLRELWRREGD